MTVYTVHVVISASTSSYWAKLSFEDGRGETHEREIAKDRQSSINSNYLQALTPHSARYLHIGRD